MSEVIRVAAASVNLIPLDWSHNKKIVQGAIDNAVQNGAQLIVLPELSTTGYGCEDSFFMEGVAEEAIDLMLSLSIPSHVFAIVGLPVNIGNRLYNGAALIEGGSKDNLVHGIYLKQNLAKNGVHYEPRWFNAWNKGEKTKLSIGKQKNVPVGDIIFDLSGIKVGMEVCEDAWIPRRPGIELFDHGVDIIINPSASHFAIGKYDIREQFVTEGSRSFGAAYIYANLNGCESGRAIFDGGNLIAHGGKIISRGERLFHKPYSVNFADIDIWENRITHQVSSQSVPALNADYVECDAYWEEPLSRISTELPSTQSWQDLNGVDFENEEVVRAVALGLKDWMVKTCTNGFMLSLSGGADSALVASEVAMMVHIELNELGVRSVSELPEHYRKFCNLEDGRAYMYGDIAENLISNILHTIYQGTENSSDVTFNAAKNLAEGIGAKFSHWNIDTLVSEYTQMTEKVIGRELGWETDDIALQNIQARSRVPGLYMVANIENRLLLSTSNMSESAVGYTTAAGDLVGSIASISGIRKTRVRALLRWLEEVGLNIDDSCFHKIEELHDVNVQQPTAELRPDEQTDEEDLMPFSILDSIINQMVINRRSPKGVLKYLKRNFSEFSDEQLIGFIKHYYQLFSRNQWKRDTTPPGFHIEQDSLDPKTFARFPLLNSGFRSEIDALEKSILSK